MSNREAALGKGLLKSKDGPSEEKAEKSVNPKEDKQSKSSEQLSKDKNAKKWAKKSIELWLTKEADRGCLNLEWPNH